MIWFLGFVINLIGWFILFSYIPMSDIGWIAIIWIGAMINGGAAIMGHENGKK